MTASDVNGLFETIRVEEGTPWRLELHLDRLYDGLECLDLRPPESREEVGEAIRAAAARAPRPLARLRITVARRSDDEGCAGSVARSITTRPYRPPTPDAYRRGVEVIVHTGCRLTSDRPDAGLKSLSRDSFRQARREAERRGAWEALLLNEDGRLVEGSRSNLVIVRDGQALTPPIADGALPGTVRSVLMEAGDLREGHLTVADLDDAGEVLLTNALVEVLPVGAVDSQPVPVGPVGEALRRRVRERGP